MDSEAHDSILALQALLNFKRSAQIISEIHLDDNPGTVISRDKTSAGAKALFLARSQTQQRIIMNDNKLAAQKKPGTSISIPALVATANTTIEVCPDQTNCAKKPETPLETTERRRVTQHLPPSQYLNSLNFNPYLFGRNSGYNHFSPFSQPENTVPTRDVENPVLLQSRVSRIPHAYSTPGAHIAPREEISKLPTLPQDAATKHELATQQTQSLTAVTHQADMGVIYENGERVIQTDQSRVIRSEEVEAALRSKSQRGKKRNNLSVLERLELTRTRNREHAKCTRARKKMRLDELESNESKYFELKIKEDLAIARRECVQKFMTLRTEVLHKRQRNKGAESAWQFSLDPVGNGNETKDELVKSSHRSLSLSESNVELPHMRQTTCMKSDSKIDMFRGVVRDFEMFKFVFQHGNTFASNGLEHLLDHEEKILDYMKTSHGNSNACSIEYQIVGGPQGVTIGVNDTGYALVELVLIISEHQKVTYNGFIEFQFANNLHELTYFKHHEFLAKPYPESQSSASSPLSHQVTFPSVVSLDVPNQGHAKSRLELHTYDIGSRREKAQEGRVERQNSHEKVDILSTIDYQPDNIQNPVGMDF